MTSFIKRYWHEHKNFRRIVGVLCIITGFIALVTPFTPGSWLILVGLEIFGIRILLWEKIKKRVLDWWNHKKTPRLILGSQSPRRARILKEMGYKPEIMPADIDERAIRSDNPDRLVALLARAKADAILPHITSPAILITADLVVIWNGQIREKPTTPEEARQFLKECSQAKNVCIAGVSVVNCQTKVRREGIDRASVWLNPIPESLIEELVASGDTYGWGGGFEISDLRMRPFVSCIEGETETIMGLPKTLTEKLIREVITSKFS